MNFGKKIKELRINRKWGQEYVANKLHISVPALSRYESGKYEPKSMDLIKSFSEIFDVSIDYLLGNSNSIIVEQEFNNKYKEYTKGLTEEEIKMALEFYKNIKEMKNKQEGR